MSPEISRRELARVGMAGVLAFTGLGIATPVDASPSSFDPVLGIQVESPTQKEFSIAEKQDFIRHLKSYADRLPPTPGIETQEDLGQWTQEIIPYFDMLGFTQTERQPSSVSFTLFHTSLQNFHILGEASCNPKGVNEGGVQLNGRMENPKSPWYGREDSVWTITHELAHIQGGPMCTGQSADLEANTQIVTAETLAAMTNSGNRQTLKVLLDGLVEMGLSDLQFEMSNDPEGFDAFQKEIKPDPYYEARYQLSLRSWQSDPLMLMDILEKYNKVPFDAILEGVHDDSVDRVKFPVSDGSPYYPQYTDEPMKVDNLIYVLKNLEAFTQNGVNC